MSPPKPILSVATRHLDAYIRITGRANFTASPDFKTLLVELSRRGYQRIVLDLAECRTMDSCFLGVTVGIGRQIVTDPSGRKIELLNPSENVEQLIDGLGAAHLFSVQRGELPGGLDFSTIVATASDRRGLSRTSLEAHQELITLNEANAGKFKDVVRFLAEDLKKSDG